MQRGTYEHMITLEGSDRVSMAILDFGFVSAMISYDLTSDEYARQIAQLGESLTLG